MMLAFAYNVFMGCMAVKSPSSPLTPMLGEWEEEGTVLSDGVPQAVYSHSTCSSLTSPNDIQCNGQSGGSYAWLEVYRWDPKTGTVDFQSLTTTPGDRICEGTGTWDAATQTLSIDAVIRGTYGNHQSFRLKRILSEEGSRLEYYTTLSGKEVRTLDVQSRAHHGVEIDYKLPYDLLQGSYKSWLRISIDPIQGVMKGCRAEQQLAGCEMQSVSLVSGDLQQYYMYKEHLFPLKECSSIAPHAHDIIAEIRVKGKTYKNTFYYNPNGMEHHHADDACPQVSEMAKWAYRIWDDRKSENVD